MKLEDYSDLKKSSFGERFWMKIGQTDSLPLKGMVTFLAPRYFHGHFYSKAHKVSALKNVINLSFDIDLHRDIESLPSLVDKLSPYDHKLSFGCIGKMIEKFPKEHRLLVDNGHEILNHTYSHPPSEDLGNKEQFELMSIEDQKKEISLCHETCKAVLAYSPTGFRVPHFGVQQVSHLYDLLAELGYTYSSSILSVKAPTFGAPFLRQSIVELPILTCPDHPFQAMDTYHAFRSKYTSHKEEGAYYDSVLSTISSMLDQGVYVNLYFDPLDVASSKHFEHFLNALNEKRIAVESYASTLKRLA